jgi:nucleoside-diphosphate-sugar epimerase
MKAFVTGASGFIGTHLMEALVRRGWQARGFDLSAPAVSLSGTEFRRGDITDFDGLKYAMKGADAVFHLASALGGSLISEEEFFLINSGGTENVLRAVRELGVKKTVHFSSAGVLGAVKDGDIADEKYPPAPLTVYDRSKLGGEELARRSAEEGLNVSIVRPGWVYGPRDRRSFKLIKTIAKRRFFLVAGGRGRQTPIHVGDLVEGAILCAEKGRPGEIYNIAGPRPMTVREMCKGIAKALGTRISRFILPALPAKAAAAVLETLWSPLKKEAPLTRGKLSFFLHSKPLSIHKAEEELGFLPKTDFAEGMARTIAWYRENGWL